METEIVMAKAGTLESGDISIVVTPNNSGNNNIDLDSIVMLQYGETITKLMHKVLAYYQVVGLDIKAFDRGAVDFTIEARLVTALLRSGAIKEAKI